MASRNRHELSIVSELVHPVSSATASGGKKMLQKVMISRLKRGMRMVVVVMPRGVELVFD